jgi:hypothetical protein
MAHRIFFEGKTENHLTTYLVVQCDV